MNDLVDFRSPFAGEGSKKSFEIWCEKHKLDSKEEYKKLSEFLSTFPLKVCPISQHNGHNRTWLSWYLASECHQRNIARGVM